MENLAESSKERYGSKRAVFPVMVKMMLMVYRPFIISFIKFHMFLKSVNRLSYKPTKRQHLIVFGLEMERPDLKTFLLRFIVRVLIIFIINEMLSEMT
jgi:hypothetical protein